jgi:hypothetical protein
MDEVRKKNHLGKHADYVLSCQKLQTSWLYNYRGGSFFCTDASEIRKNVK